MKLILNMYHHGLIYREDYEGLAYSNVRWVHLLYTLNLINCDSKSLETIAYPSGAENSERKGSRYSIIILL